MTTCNAYAVGKDPAHAVVVLGVPLIQALARDELDAVIGHELGHIASGDMQKMQMAVGFQSVFTFLAAAIGEIAATVLYRLVAQHSRSEMDRQFAHDVGQLFMAISNVSIAVGSNLCLCALSRKREYFADAVGAALTSPEAMQRALIRIHKLGDAPSAAEKSHDVLMFRGGWRGNFFSTHPTLDQRLAALRSGEYQQLLDHARGRRARRAEMLAAIAAGLAPMPGKVVAYALAALYAVKNKLPKTYSFEKTWERVDRVEQMLAEIQAKLTPVPGKIAAHILTALSAVKDRLPSLTQVVKLTLGVLITASVAAILLWGSGRDNPMVLDSRHMTEVHQVRRDMGGGETEVSKTLPSQPKQGTDASKRKASGMKAKPKPASEAGQPKRRATPREPEQAELPNDL